MASSDAMLRGTLAVQLLNAVQQLPICAIERAECICMKGRGDDGKNLGERGRELSHRPY